MKKNIIKILIFVLCLTSIGCSSNSTKQHNNEIEETVTQIPKEIPEYEYNDTFYNHHLSMDENENYYIAVGKYIYKIDKNNKVSPITKRYLNNRFFIYTAKYYQSKLYLLITDFNGKFKVASMSTDGKEFDYLFDIKLTDLPNTNLVINDDKIYLYNNSQENPYIRSYSINAPYSLVTEDYISISQQRYDFMKHTFPNYPYNHILYILNDSFYSKVTTRIEGSKPKTNIDFIQYNPLNDTKKKYNLNKYLDKNTNTHPIQIDLINNYWFILSKHGVYKLNLDFSNEIQVISPKDLSYYTFNSKSGKIIVEE